MSTWLNEIAARFWEPDSLCIAHNTQKCQLHKVYLSLYIYTWSGIRWLRRYCSYDLLSKSVFEDAVKCWLIFKRPIDFVFRPVLFCFTLVAKIIACGIWFFSGKSFLICGSTSENVFQTIGNRSILLRLFALCMCVATLPCNAVSRMSKLWLGNHSVCKCCFVCRRFLMTQPLFKPVG